MQRNRYIIHSSLVVNISVLLSGRTQLGCPEQVSLYGYGSEKTAGVYRWEDCSRLCRQRVGCLYWTWRDRTSGTRALQCVTMTNVHFKNHHDPAAISGDRHCGVDSSFPDGHQLQCPSQGLQLISDSAWQQFPNVNSWEDCARTCRVHVKMKYGDGKPCKYWTWDNRFYNCTIRDGILFTNHQTFEINGLDHLFSGDNTCGSKGVKGNIHSFDYKREALKSSGNFPTRFHISYNVGELYQQAHTMKVLGFCSQIGLEHFQHNVSCCKVVLEITK